jgi:hypothetical protein
MLTLFAIPKAFCGQINTIQRNAIQSWTLLRPQPEIILLGDDEGTAEVAQEFNLIHIPKVDRNSQGTPLVNSVFEQAQMKGKGEIFAYVNSDIILFSDFMHAVEQVSFKSFLMAGQRWNLDLDQSIAFKPGWEAKLHDRIMQSAQLEGPQAIDYFVFSRNVYNEIPPFAIGRVCWDNWLLYKALSLNIPLIDATEAVTAIHQNHDYNHHPEGKEGVFLGIEAQQNSQLLGGRDYAFFMLDLANWLLTSEGLEQPEWTRHRWYRALEMLPLVRPELRSWAACCHYLLSHHFYANLDELEMNQARQDLGEALFARSDCWFNFSLDHDVEAQMIYLPTPAENEINGQLKQQLQQAVAEKEQLKNRIAAIATSKFWRLRQVWFRFKRLFGMGQNE